MAAPTAYFVGLFFGVEAADQTYLGAIPAFLVSATNPDWAWPILLLSLAGYAVTGAYLFWRFKVLLRRPARRTGAELAERSA